MTLQINTLSYKEKARIASGFPVSKQVLLVRAFGIEGYARSYEHFVALSADFLPADGKLHVDFDAYFWHRNRTALAQREYGHCDCAQCADFVYLREVKK